MRRTTAAVLAGLWLLVGPAPPARAGEPLQHLFYEATTAAAPADTPFAARRAMTERVRGEIVPPVLAAAGLAADAAVTTPTVGGWQLATNPSLHTAATLSDAAADRLAAALGYVLRQDSVLVADLSDGDGHTGAVVVRFPDGGLTPELAQRFFRHAAGVAEGLGGGYTAFGDTMLFLNVRDDDGTPYSGLADDAFAAALEGAAAGFPDAPLTTRPTTTADARFVSNDWTAAPDGAGYRRRLEPELVHALDPLKDKAAALQREAPPHP